MTRRQIVALILLLAALNTVFLIFIAPNWLWHPLGYCTGTPIAIRDCKSYNFWSGISGSDLEIPFLVAAFTIGWWRTHNCHEYGCPWLVFHNHPEHGHPVCRRHYEAHPDGFIPGKSEALKRG